jgi:hypothetical protein
VTATLADVDRALLVAFGLAPGAAQELDRIIGRETAFPALEAWRQAGSASRGALAPGRGRGHLRRGARRGRMKNPLMSMWLSHANRALGVGRGMVTAEMRRQQSAAAKEAMRALGLGGTAKPKRKRAVKRKAK